MIMSRQDEEAWNRYKKQRKEKKQPLETEEMFWNRAKQNRKERTKEPYQPTVKEQLYDKLDHLNKCHTATNLYPLRYQLFLQFIRVFKEEYRLKLVNRYMCWFFLKHGDPSSDPKHADVFYPNATKMRINDEN